jgi:O-methyltransferase
VSLDHPRYSPWLTDELFREVYAAIQAHTLVDRYRLYELWQLVDEAAKLDTGDVLEVGVWRGGTGCLIAKRRDLVGLRCHVYLCDTFAGVPNATDLDPWYEGGEWADTSKDTVLDLTRRLQLESVQVLQGIFPQETGKIVADRTFRLCHIDVDVYQSAREVTAWVWERLVTGGLIVFDDYGFVNEQGVTHFVNEQRSQDDRLVIYNLNGHAIVVKLA